MVNGVRRKNSTVCGMILAACGVLGISACATSTATQSSLDYYDVQSPSQLSAVEQLVPGRQSLDGISRIEIAEAVTRFDKVANEQANDLISMASTSSVFVPAMGSHETSNGRAQTGERLIAQVNPERKITNTLRDAEDYNVRAISSASGQIPPGWDEVAGVLTHANSGMVCPYGFSTEDNQFSVTLQRIQLFDQNGLDVGCQYASSNGGLIMVYSSYWPDISQEDHAVSAARLIIDGFGTDKVVDVPYADVRGEDGKQLEQPSVIGYEATIQETQEAVKTSLWLVKTEGWHVKARATHMMADELTEAFAVMMFAQTHMDVRTKNIRSPLGGVEV